MENGVAEKQASSYTYWVRESKSDAAPPPVPRKLSAEDVSKQQPLSTTLGSVWNQAGTWEEKNLNTWASNRIKELLASIEPLELSNGKASITDVSKCAGDAFLVTVRNKKRVGYTYELTLKFRGELSVQDKKELVKGHIDIAEFSYGELEDLQMEVKVSNENKDLADQDKVQIGKELKLFLPSIREKLLEFEQELKDR
ncbi:hypothetical protein QJS10_CPB18g00016 [Acorus calamus]|uniref:Activator of Hsp90 ATPase AHSA1-like N-terminal domain-containing protein n=1 Tax=Acorus calamus TaxID=4465 RepID=A0AAV9CJW9_ACOCL|nr:hypothetical protein QJS10_CPB18g00016 [Acorus calamus]